MLITTRFLITLLICYALFCAAALANFNIYEFDDNAQRERFYYIIKELRCPKCQNNNLADSNAPLATDIKKYVYNSLKMGKSNDDITDYLISRYGQFITYRPRNIWLWLLPFVVAFLSLGLATRTIQRNRKSIETELDSETIPSMDRLIDDYNKKAKP